MSVFRSKQTDFYSLKEINKRKCPYNVIWSGRSNGKTFAVLDQALEDYFKSGGKNELAIIRRSDTDWKGQNSARNYYLALMEDAYGVNHIEKYSEGAFHGVVYWGGLYYLTVRDEEGREQRTDKIIARGFPLNKMEAQKGARYPNVMTILFDEFITRGFYLQDEFILFCNVIKTIKGDRTDVTVYMCGNSVNRFNPYFQEMGLRRAATMEQGTIDVYRYGDTPLRVACEYAEMAQRNGKHGDYYFAFDNPRLEMIKTGAWELDIYPHCPVRYEKSDIAYTYFIEWAEDLYQCEIVATGKELFTFIHRKSTPLKERSSDVIFSTTPSPKPNYRQNLLQPPDQFGRRLASFYASHTVFYQDNEVGEAIRNYLVFCKQQPIVKTA